MAILVTGGAGYIGAHACKALLARGHDVVALDNLYRGHEAAIERLRAMPGVGPSRMLFHKGDVQDRALLERVMKNHRVDTILHFAALAYVRESMDQPLPYYRNNTAAAVSLIEAAAECGVRKLIFSSTCATYGEPDPSLIPIREDCTQVPINPYGWSKLFIERMLMDHAAVLKRAGTPFAVAMLRYFNVAGCDRTGVIGEDHTPETHIIPIMLQVALGQRASLTIFGEDHPTPDGTCVRDYIHVEDLVDAHVRVMEALDPSKNELRAYNLGIGRGYSIREVLESARRVTGHAIPAQSGPRHPGDPPTLFCDPSKIERELGWKASVRSIDDILASAWAWFKAHPRGYKG